MADTCPRQSIWKAASKIQSLQKLYSRKGKVPCLILFHLLQGFFPPLLGTSSAFGAGP